MADVVAAVLGGGEASDCVLRSAKMICAWLARAKEAKVSGPMRIGMRTDMDTDAPPSGGVFDNADA